MKTQGVLFKNSDNYISQMIGRYKYFSYAWAKKTSIDYLVAGNAAIIIKQRASHAHQ